MKGARGIRVGTVKQGTLIILKRYPTPERIGTSSKEDLGAQTRKWSISKFGVQEAESLIGLAWKAVGLEEGLASILMQLEEGKRFVSEIEVEMVATLERIPFSGSLTGGSFGEYSLLDRQPI